MDVSQPLSLILNYCVYVLTFCGCFSTPNIVFVSQPLHVSSLCVLCVFVAGEGSEWSVKRTRRLTSASSPDYAVLEANGQGIIVASDKPFKFVYDSESPPQTVESGAVRDQDKDRDGECVRSIWLVGGGETRTGMVSVYVASGWWEEERQGQGW